MQPVLISDVSEEIVTNNEEKEVIEITPRYEAILRGIRPHIFNPLVETFVEPVDILTHGILAARTFQDSRERSVNSTNERYKFFNYSTWKHPSWI